MLFASVMLVSVVLWTAEDNEDYDAYEYCDDFEEYTPEQVSDGIFSFIHYLDICDEYSGCPLDQLRLRSPEICITVCWH